MKMLLKPDSPYRTLFPFGVLLILAFPFVWIEKGSIVLFINDIHTSWGDFFFKYVTYLGDGWGILVCFLAALYFSKRWIFSLAIGSGLLLAIVHSFKGFFFNGMLRPKPFLEEKGFILKLVEGVEVHSYNTFPSGHTTTAFFMAAFFAIYFQNSKISWSLCLIAFAVGISRMYLSQHFAIDVYFGMIFGLFCAIFSHWLIHRKTPAL